MISFFFHINSTELYNPYRKTPKICENWALIIKNNEYENDLYKNLTIYSYHRPTCGRRIVKVAVYEFQPIFHEVF